MRAGASFLAGVLFALGLGLSGMTDANKVIGFLEVSARWDPSLALVMIGAIGVHLPLYALIRRRERPLLSAGFTVPTTTGVDARLLVGAGVFGVGWALGGFCPGPAVVSLASGRLVPVLFVASASLGMLAFRLWDTYRVPRPAAQSEPEPQVIAASTPVPR